MLEVEQQFSITQQQANQLLDSAHNITVLQLEEVYFDTADFSLLKNDCWLRLRNNKYELKYRKPENRDGSALEIYKEYATESEIKTVLNISSNENLSNYIENKFQPVIEISTERKSFELEGYHVDIDFTNFGYIVCEIERETDNKDSVEIARQQIVALALQLGLSQEPARNKAKEYIFRTHPVLSEELQRMGIL